MDSYIEITVKPDAEFTVPTLMNVVFEKLHHAFVKVANKDVGISFPMVTPESKTLGSVLRLHGTQPHLEKLQSTNWLQGMMDYTESSKILSTPQRTQFCQVRRIQVKSNADRLRRRFIKRHPDASVDTIKTLFDKSKEKHSKLPFLRIKSSSSQQQFRLFLEHLPAQEKQIKGEFNAYGLSNSATVPWF
jgi:CRISPR-associated endonuclease Csy4